MIKVEPSNIGMLDVSEIEDLHQIVDDINHSINRIRNAGGEGMAEILKNIGQAVISDPFLDKRMAGLTIAALRTLASEASLPAAERRLGFVRGALAYISMLLRTSRDILSYWQAHSGDFRAFFGIPG